MIEIMIALLGVMIAVLTLIAGLFSAAVAIVGVFGYQTIREEARKKAESTAKEIAEAAVNGALREFRDQTQGAGLSESQLEDPEKETASLKPQKGRKKATTDKSLKK